MNTDPATRMNTLYHTLFDIYDCLIVLATDLIHQHDTAAISSLIDLTDLFAALSLPIAGASQRPQQSNGSKPQLFGTFAICTRHVEGAVKTYGELRAELAGTRDQTIAGAWEKLDAIAQTVGRLYEVLKAMLAE